MDRVLSVSYLHNLLTYLLTHSHLLEFPLTTTDLVPVALTGNPVVRDFGGHGSRNKCRFVDRGLETQNEKGSIESLFGN